MRARMFLAILLAACGASATPSPDAGSDAFAPPIARAAPVVTRAAPPSPRVHVDSGTVLAGSRPGTPWRRPSVEADLAPITVPAFEIDRRVLTATDRADPQRVSSRDAISACSARGGRLCDELEWERACEGDVHVSLPTTGDYAACTAHPSECASAMGLIAQGVLALEWTLSAGQLVLRGARDDQDTPMHRCDARVLLVDPSDREAAVRCCYGAAPSLTYPASRGGMPFSNLELSLDALRAAMRSTPELAPWADDFTPFDLAGAERAYSRADLIVDETTRARLAPGPLLWSPANGERAWLFAGQSGADTIIAVLYPLDDGTSVVHGASFVFRGEHVPVAITPVPRERTSVSWSTAVGRAGESGLVRLDEDGVVRIVAQ